MFTFIDHSENLYVILDVVMPQVNMYVHHDISLAAYPLCVVPGTRSAGKMDDGTAAAKECQTRNDTVGTLRYRYISFIIMNRNETNDD